MARINLEAAFLLLLTSSFFCCTKKGDQEILSPRQPITFTFFSSDAIGDLQFTDPVAMQITQKTGVTLELHCPKNNDEQAVNLMIASGAYDDLIYAKGDTTKLIDAHAVIALDDWISPEGKHINLIESYGTHLKELYGDQLVKLRHSDGHIYSFGTYDVKKAFFETAGTVQIQHAVLKELGYPKITTLNQYADAIRSYMKKYPQIDGQKTIGFSLLMGKWQWLIDLSNPGNYVIGYPDDGEWIVDKTTHHAQYKFLNREIDYYYRWLNELYHDGTLDPESFTQSEEVWKSKIASGRILGIAYPSWGYSDARAQLIATDKPERTYAYLSVVADSLKYKDPSLTDYGFSGGWGISISASCKDVVRAFMFIDWMCSEEAQVLVNWGIKDVNYTVVDGKKTVSSQDQILSDIDPDYLVRVGIGKWVYPFPERGTGAIDSNGDWITRNNRQRVINNYIPVERETLAAYGATLWTDLFPQPSELSAPVHGQLWQYQLPKEINDSVAAADEYVKDALVKCIVCSPSQFDTEWNKMVQQLYHMRMDAVGEQVSEIIKKKLQLWGVE